MSDPEALVRRLLKYYRVFNMFNMEMVELNHERCVIEMTVTEEMTNGAGVCQGRIAPAHRCPRRGAAPPGLVWKVNLPRGSLQPC